MNLRWLILIRDVAIVWGLTFVGGFIVGVSEVEGSRKLLAIATSNILLGTIAFSIVGCLTPTQRFRHLFVVALGAWLTSVFNVLGGAASVVRWLFSVVILLITAGAGGGLSFLFVRTPDVRPNS